VITAFVTSFLITILSSRIRSYKKVTAFLTLFNSFLIFKHIHYFCVTNIFDKADIFKSERVWDYPKNKINFMRVWLHLLCLLVYKKLTILQYSPYAFRKEIAVCTVEIQPTVGLNSPICVWNFR
jgi:hypothetical protein